MKKRIIITGGNGQDGIILSKMLLKNKYEVYSFINRTKFIKIPKLNYLNVNLLNQRLVNSLIDNIKPYAIIHLAAKNNSTIVRKNLKDKYFYNKNISITKNLINSIINDNKKIKFIFAGSSLMFKKTKGIVNEGSTLKSSCYYSKYKISAHKYLIKMKRKFNLLATTAILFNHDSKYRNSKFLFPRLAKYIQLNDIKKINEIYKQNIFGDFSHAEDICEGILLLLRSLKNPDKIIFSSNKLSGINKLIEYGINQKKKKYLLKSPSKKTIKLIGNNSLSKKLLRWKPKKNYLYAFKEILER